MIPRSRLLRLAELGIVLAVGVYPVLFNSIFYLVTGAATTLSDDSGLRRINLIASELIALMVLLYVVHQQGGTLQSLGLRRQWRDIPISVGLTVVGYLAFYLAYILLAFAYAAFTGSTYTQANPAASMLRTPLLLISLLLVLVNPFYEELIVRAFTIVQVEALTGKASLAVLVSVGLQVSYHLYQGIVPALAEGATFLVLSLYFVQSRKIVPVILAHLFFDLVALFSQTLG